jgi:hypothetical protein
MASPLRLHITGVIAPRDHGDQHRPPYRRCRHPGDRLQLRHTAERPAGRGDWYYSAGHCAGSATVTRAASAGLIGRNTPSGKITEFRIPATTSYPFGSVPQDMTAGPDGNLWFTEQ